MTIFLILSLILGIIVVNTKFINLTQSESFIDQKTDTTQPDNFILSFINLLQSSETQSNPLPIILSDLNLSVPFEDLQIRLHGIVYNGENASYALISRRRGVQEVYQTGSSIFNNTTVREITKNQVKINYYDESHILKMESRGNNDSLPYWKTVENDIQQQRITLEEDKRRNPIRLLMIRRPFAVVEGGRFLGYKIMSGGNTDQFIRLGFESGDIMTSLNGKTLDGPSMQHFIISELTHSRNLDLVVLRGQDQLSIMYGF